MAKMLSITVTLDGKSQGKSVPVKTKKEIEETPQVPEGKKK